MTPEQETPSPREVSGLTVTSRDGRLSAVIPSAFIVHRQNASIAATTADGTGRIYVGHVPTLEIPAYLGGFKDELLGLGAQVLEEKHFERATRLVSDEGPRNARLRRRSWIIEAKSGGVIVCEAFFQAGAETEWSALVDALCLKATINRPERPEADAPSAEDATP